MPESGRHALGLPIAVTALMLGIVVAANPGRFGVPGAWIGLVVAVAAAALAIRLFRSGRSRRAAGPADNPDGSGNT
jgi:uncharacterized membrane protein YccC